MNIHPWDLKRYTLRELFYRVEIRGQGNKQQAEIITQQFRTSWNQVRWQTAQLANFLGAKLTSVYQVAVFDWDKLETEPAEDILKHFPKTLKK